MYSSEGAGWTPKPDPHQDDQRKQVWIKSFPVVQGEKPTSFQLAAMAADAVSLVTNWGDQGLEYINADLSLVMARLPVGEGVGLAAQHRVPLRWHWCVKRSPRPRPGGGRSPCGPWAGRLRLRLARCSVGH